MSYTLGVADSSKNPSDYFGISSGSSLMADLHVSSPGSQATFGGGSFQAPTFGSSLASRDPHFNLGVDLSQPAHRAFGVASASDLMGDLRNPLKPTFAERFTRDGPPKPGSTILKFGFDSAAEFTPLKSVSTAMDLGQGVHEITKAMDESAVQGISKKEAALCKTTKVFAETAITTAGTGMLLFGIPVLVAETAISPPIAAVSATIAAQKLPEAAANLDRLGKVVGDMAEDSCLQYFSNKRAGGM